MLKLGKGLRVCALDLNPAHCLAALDVARRTRRSASWKLLGTAIREAIQYPGRQIEVLKCSYLVARGFLWCRLPSGRCLAYGAPKLNDQVWARIYAPELDGDSWTDAQVMDREHAESW